MSAERVSWVFGGKCGYGKIILTSGYPLGSKKASGMPQLGGNPGMRSARSEGGVGAAVYSVKARPLRLGVVGVVTPLAEGSSDMINPQDL